MSKEKTNKRHTNRQKKRETQEKRMMSTKGKKLTDDGGRAVRGKMEEAEEKVCLIPGEIHRIEGEGVAGGAGVEREGARRNGNGGKGSGLVGLICWATLGEWTFRLFVVGLIAYLMVKIKELEEKIDCSYLIST